MKAFIFPGQGSQKLGMLSDFYQEYAQVADIFTEASDVLGYDLWQTIQNDEQKLGQTEYTQPALLASSIAIWRVYQSLGHDQPAYLAGHSLGEYSALVAAGALSFADGLRLVAKRGQLMQSAVPQGQGAMAVVLNLTNEQVQQCCQQVTSGLVSAVNFNAPGQVVIAGETMAVDAALPIAKEMGAKRAMRLPVSVPSHCALMAPAAERLQQALAQVIISQPTLPVIHNVDVEMHEQPEDIMRALVAQLTGPVRWVETIEKLSSLDVDQFVECGPGAVLTGLGKRIIKEAQHVSLSKIETLKGFFHG